MLIRKWLRLLALPAFLAYACSSSSNTPVTPTPAPTPTPTPIPTPTPSAPTAFLVGAGDIADCRSAPDGNSGVASEATAKLIDQMTEAWVFTMGDSQYFLGSSAEYRSCYHARWGRFLSRTYPSPGNHDYENGTNGSGYFDYYSGRPNGGAGLGAYSYTLGNWHIIALNSGPGLPVSVATEQYQWLKRDLADNKSFKCTLAYWHHPVFTSGPSAGSNGIMRDVYQLLFENGVDVVVNGHDHLYERFFSQDHLGIRNPAAGVTEYIVGTGGAPLYEFGPALPNSAFRLRGSFGVLYFTLKDLSWDSVFIEAGTQARLDPSNSNLCH